jgi:hypothetical protein
VRIASKINTREARTECWKTRHVGLAYLEQPLSYLDEAVLLWRTTEYGRMGMRGAVVFDESRLKRWGLMRKMQGKMRG